MEFGLYTFVENTAEPETGKSLSPADRLSNLLEEIGLADEAGLDVFGIGEHHREEYLASSPATLLAAAAARTKHIRLTSAVTVLSSDDPVRVFQQFATLDLISGGRAEIMAGRGSFIESFPLFGYELDAYDSLFASKLDLLLKLREQARITWSGKHRAPLRDIGVYPRPLQQPLPVWIAVGGTPASVARAGTLGLPLAIAIIGGAFAAFRPMVELYRSSAERAGHDPATLPISINSPAYVADTSQQAAAEFEAPFLSVFSRIGRERGWGPMGRAQFDGLRSPQGALVAGSPQEVIDKLMAQHAIFNHQRFLGQIGIGTMPHAQIMRAIELLGTVVAPAVRKALGVAGA